MIKYYCDFCGDQLRVNRLEIPLVRKLHKYEDYQNKTILVTISAKLRIGAKLEPGHLCSNCLMAAAKEGDPQ